MTARTFLAKHPLFGIKSKPLPLKYQESSVYYWWWQYLLRNQSYKQCCESLGDGELSGLYRDFGDVFATDFRTWWTTGDRGAMLFAEQPREIKQMRLTSKDQWDETWSEEEAAVFVFPLSVGRRKIQSLFAKQLAKIHMGKRGRVSLATAHSTAKYPLSRNFNVNTLKTGLAIYDAWLENCLLSSSERQPMWKIGEALNVNPSSNPSATDTKYETTNKRNVLTVTVSRHLAVVKRLIANTSHGRFPDATSVN